jgi:hypothetical protein
MVSAALIVLSFVMVGVIGALCAAIWIIGIKGQ